MSGMRATVTMDGKTIYHGPKSYAEGLARNTRRRLRDRGEPVRGRVKVQVHR
jgi:hypothetical protein